MKSDPAFCLSLLDSVPDLIFVRSYEGRMLYCNRALAGVAGINIDEFLEPAFNMWPAAEDQKVFYRELESRVIETGEEVVIEEQIIDTAGQIRFYLTRKRAFTDPAGAVHVLSVSTNIDRIKGYQKEMQRVLQMRNDFFSSLSHEIRTPMNAIIGMTELLLKRSPRKDQLKLLQTLGFSSRNLLHLINEILDFSKMEAGKIEFEKINFSLPELLDHIRGSHLPRADSHGLKLELITEDNCPEVVNGDPVRLTQILNNLLGNALKFTVEGFVRLEAGVLEKTAEGYIIRFQVADSGIGIPATQLESIFDPFHQASPSTTRLYGGTGLGLAIVRNIAELQSGKVTVESMEGRGTRFTVDLPFALPDPGQPVRQQQLQVSGETRWKKRLRVLYVEDVSTNQFLIAEILGGWGVDVMMAGDGYQALELIQREQFDLVLMDIQMPGISGYETTRRIRSLEREYFRNVPIIALTASTSEDTRHEIFRCGMQDYVTKPINMDELRTKIIEYTNIPEERTGSEEDLSAGPVLTDSGAPTAIDFASVDRLFTGNRSRYDEFLRLSIDEFKANHEKLKECLKERDPATFRQVRHRMKSLISTFGMKELSEYLDQVKERLELGTAAAGDEREASITLALHIEYIIDVLEHKIASLKWQ